MNVSARNVRGVFHVLYAHGLISVLEADCASGWRRGAFFATTDELIVEDRVIHVTRDRLLQFSIPSMGDYCIEVLAGVLGAVAISCRTHTRGCLRN